MTDKTASLFPRVLFCSYHGFLDPSSGAAISTRDLLELLAARGWPCTVLSGPHLDFEPPDSFGSLLRREQISFQSSRSEVAGIGCTLFDWLSNRVPVHVFVPHRERPHKPDKPPSQEEGRAFLQLFDRIRQHFQPDILLTYGGQWLMGPLIQRAKQMGVRVVFTLRNLSYSSAEIFRGVDAVVVPSQASQRHYQEKLGLACTVLPGPWNWERFSCPSVKGRYVTFINPQPAKGLYWFVRILYEMNQKRPDIPFLVVEGRGRVKWFTRCHLDLTALNNLHMMPSTSDPRAFYRQSRMVLMPSLCQEAFGRVAVEAHSNGIPVLASRRCGLPEAMSGAGFLFDIPQHYTEKTRQVPTAAEVTPWIQIIERLWDDDGFYAQESLRCREAIRIWHPDQLVPRFEEFFRRLVGSRK
jgi:glycosyltransferase involved in cell wall biosynthesis